MEETQALKDVENSLRDFISILMQELNGNDWINFSGISENRISQWNERREIEIKKQKFGTAETRLLYFSDFYDLITIIDKNWNEKFKAAFGDKAEMMTFLKILDDYRNSDAHRRELLPHQKHLIIGISGDIRNRIVLYRSKKETGEDYFPRIESVRDNLGNVCTPQQKTNKTNLTLRVGDKITFVVTASDPLGENLQYSLTTLFDPGIDWQESNVVEIILEDRHIAKDREFLVMIRSKRDYHASELNDDSVIYSYSILPKN